MGRLFPKEESGIKNNLIIYALRTSGQSPT